MGWLDDIKKKMKEVGDDLATRVAKFANEAFLEAAMAFSALVSGADGSVDEEEIDSVVEFIGTNPALQVFDPKKAESRFRHYCEEVNKGAFDKAAVMNVVAKMKGNDEASRALIDLGIEIGGADGDFDADEKKVVRKACLRLGIDPAEYDL